MRILLLLGVLTWQVANATEPSRKYYYDVRTADTFTDRSFKAIAEDVSGNFVYSPLSLVMILSMVSLGAAGNTRYQLLNAIQRPYNFVSYSKLEHSSENSDAGNRVRLNLANKIFLAKGFEPKFNFMSLTAKQFRSEAWSVDFGNPAEASKMINGWFAAMTNNLIRDLVNPADLNSETTIILANSIYFKGEWVKKFDEDETSMLPFYVNGMTTVKNVPTMRKVDSYRYGELPEVNAKFIELPYVDYGSTVPTSMYIILPDEVDGISALIKNFDKVTIHKLTKGEKWDIELFLPKFKVETSLDLQSSLAKLGVTDMFEPSADFSNISVTRPLKVSKIIQKTFIEVNEHGTEAASATGTLLGNRLRDEPELTFAVNRPFVAVVAVANGMFLFTTVIMDPTSTD